MIPDRLPLVRRLRRAFWRVPIDSEIADELAAHIELQTRRYMDADMSEADARQAARLRFGDLEQVRTECRDIRNDMETDMQRAELRQELRMDAEFAVRTLRRSPLFAAVAVLTIALAIGANTAIFSVVDAVLLRGLPYRFADRVVLIWNSNSQGAVSRTAVAAPEYFDLKDQLRAHDAVGAISRQPSALVADGGEPERLMAYVVTPNIFDLLGTAPAIGRTFGGDDGTQRGSRVVILSHTLWMRRFGGDPKILGRTVSVAGFPRTIVGVMPPAVRFPDAPLGFLREQADLWIPSTRETSRTGSRGNQVLAVLARRKAGVTDAQAMADVDAVSARFRAAFPDRYAVAASKNWRLEATPLRDQMVGSVRTSLLVIASAVGFVLLIACVNVANLLLARGAVRQRELAVRLALGAGRGRLIRQLLTESVVLAMAGGALGLFFAWGGIHILQRLDATHLPRIAETRVDGASLLFAVGLTLVTGLLVGAVPALQQSSSDLGAALGDAARGSSAGRRHHRLRVALVVAQVAMALVVLVGAGLLGRSFLALEGVKPGFSPANVLSLQVTLPASTYDSASKVTRFYQQLLASASAIPGVAEVSAIYPIPMSGDGWSGSFRVEGEPDGPDDPIPHAEYAVTLGSYFHTLRIPLVAGRDFAATDTRDAPPVVIVDEVLAKQHWPNQSAIGKRIGDPGQWATIVGVVGHVHNAGPQAEGEPQIYLPLAQNSQVTMSIVARSNGSPISLARPLRAAVTQLDAQLPISKLQPVDDFVSRALAKQRFDALLLGVFALTALILASVGLYGVMAYLVSQRTREIGIRMALGGEPSAIRAMVLREGILISVLGLAIGVALSLAGSKAITGLLFGVAATDGVTYGTIAALLLAVGALASYGPARRATRVDPLIALRE